MHNLFLQRGIKYLLCRVLTQGIILTVFTAMLDRWIISKLDTTHEMVIINLTFTFTQYKNKYIYSNLDIFHSHIINYHTLRETIIESSGTVAG